MEGSQYIVARRYEFDSGIKNVASVALGQTDHVFHYENGRSDFGNEPEKVAQQETAWIVCVSQTYITERLAGRASEDEIHMRVRGVENGGARKARNVTQVECGVREIEMMS